MTSTEGWSDASDSVCTGTIISNDRSNVRWIAKESTKNQPGASRRRVRFASR
jgi:hypothetical protein